MSDAKLPALEAVRGVAAVVVVVHHTMLAFAPTDYNRRTLPGTNGWHSGALAVAVFFVLSGFVLTLRYFRTRSAADLASGAVRRYPRLLLPIAASVALGYGLQAGGAMVNARAADLRPEPDRSNTWLRDWNRQPPSLWYAVKEATFRAFIGFDKDRSYNHVLWTMEVEFFGSLFVFGLAAAFGSRQRRAVLYGGVAVVLVQFGYLYLLYFLVGMALADIFTSGRLPQGWWAVPMLPVGLIVSDSPGPWQVAGAPLVVTAVVFAPVWQSLLSARPLVFLGRISFCLYLFHVPILLSAGSMVYCRVAGDGPATPAAAWAGAAATAAATLALAYVGTVTFDVWSVRLARWVDGTLFPTAAPAALSAVRVETKTVS